MPSLRPALLQLNFTVGDFAGNADNIVAAMEKAAAQNATFAIGSELGLLGYPARDLLLDRHFIEEAWRVLGDLAKKIKGSIPLIIGIAEPRREPGGKPLWNAAAVLSGGEVVQMFRKTLLPTYDVFDETRYFEPGSSPGILELDSFRIGITICEDVWNDKEFWSSPRYSVDPLEHFRSQKLDCIINLSASPFAIGKQNVREAMLRKTAKTYGVPVIYVNQVGGNDDLVFDGRSFVVDQQGSLVARGSAFEEHVQVVDLASLPSPIPPADNGPEAEAWGALVLGTRDYVHKCGFRTTLLGLSGGVDSSLTAAIAVEALGAENVLGVLLPSPHSSKGSLDDANDLARRLGIRTLTIPIGPLMKEFSASLREAFAQRKEDTTEENIQARIRGNLLMALSNKYGSLLLTTGNKSEMAVGYCTLYGDMSGGLAVLADVPKTLVYKIGRWLNTKRHEWIPETVLEKPPSAELRPGQVDQDSLPPYEILDQILQHHIEEHESGEELMARGFQRDTVRKVLDLVKKAEFKRRQAAPGIKITDRAFGTGWRMPVAART